MGLVTVNGVRVPYLDWGGTGPALVFIPGMGNSAHVFDEFAPRFTDRFRVVAVTRVGFGESDQPERDGYDLASRVAYLRATLDTLKIKSAVLVGHSLGGDEITAFAGTYPERTAGVIFLDAAIDHTVSARWQERFREFLTGAPAPGTDDRASAEAYRQYLFRVQGCLFPIGEVLALVVTDVAGTIRAQRTSPRVYAQITAATVPPDFAAIKSPTLSLYSDSATVAEMFPWLTDESARTRAESMLAEVFRPEMAAERAKFARVVKGATIYTYPAHHYQFLTVPDDTENRMRAFLSSIHVP